MKYLESSPESANGSRLGSSPSSTSVASRLYTNGQRSSRRTSFSSEPELINFDNDVHSEFTDISSQVSMISKKLSDMQDLQLVTNEEKARLRTDNAVLQERIHLLEEQFMSAEQRWKEKLDEEKARTKDIFARLEREKELEIESASLKYQVLEKDLSTLKKERERMEADAQNLYKTIDELRDQLHDVQSALETAEEEKREIREDYEKFRREAAYSMENSSELVEELTRQTDELMQRSASSMPRHGSLADQIVLLEDEIERLRDENRSLKDQNEDLQAQLLHESVTCGQSLLANETPSLAAELHGMDSTELMNALREQEVCNQKLRTYINGILMRVIERHPEILEIKDEEVNGGASTAADSGSSNPS